MNNITEIAKIVTNIMMIALEEQEESMTLSVIEETTRQLMQQIGNQVVLMAVMQNQPQYIEPVKPCSCGAEALYIRRRKTKLYTLLGIIEPERAYYLCDPCHKGFYPLDQLLGLRPNAVSEELERLLALTGVQMPFQKGRDLFEELTLISVSDQTMGKSSRKIGERVVKHETELKEKACDPDYLQAQKREAKAPLRIYGAIDAAKVNTSPDGWRDLKLGAWFEARGKPPTKPDGQWSIEAENISYFTDITAATEFSSLVWATSVERHAHIAHELIMLGDGAEWIWNIVEDNFPHAIQILDWFHASEHLMPVAKSILADEDEQRSWVKEMRILMWDGKTEELIAACQKSAATSEVARKAANYFETHKKRMRYAYFRSQGYQIGSGTIESAAKQIGLMRMKVPGARWNKDNAILVAKARASYLSDNWKNLPLAG